MKRQIRRTRQVTRRIRQVRRRTRQVTRRTRQVTRRSRQVTRRSRQMIRVNCKKSYLYTIKKSTNSFWCITGTLREKKASKKSKIARDKSPKDSSSATMIFWTAELKSNISNVHWKILTCFNGNINNWSKILIRKRMHKQKKKSSKGWIRTKKLKSLTRT